MSLSKFMRNAKAFLNGLNIKAPWKYTGINSSFEYLDYELPAETYRTPSPASHKQTVTVPDSDPEHILDITYYNRMELADEKKLKAGRKPAENLQGQPFMKVYKGKKLVALTDDGEDGGYAR
eukprot:g4410.t1